MVQGSRFKRPDSFERIARPRKPLRDDEMERPPKQGPGFLLLGLFFVAVAIVAAAWFFLLQPSLENPEVQKEPPPDTLSAAGFDFVTDKDQRKILHLKPAFVVNLAGLDGRWVMYVKIWVEVDSWDVADDLNRNPAIFYRMMDDLTRTLKSWTYAELNYGNGMERLKKQLRDHVARYVRRGAVVRVLFPDVRFDEVLPKAPPVNEEEEQSTETDTPPAADEAQ